MDKAVRWLGIATASLVATSVLASDEASRVTRTAEGFSRDRPAGALFKSPALEEVQRKPGDLVTRPKTAGTQRLASAVGGDFWVYDADADLLFDSDGDGYFHYLRVRFDVDTYFEHAYVYAMLFLSRDGEIWEHFATTDEFLVQGSTAFDEYEVETEFAEGYPPGYYDVLIEIYDADYNEFVADLGPAESPSLSLLPIEDAVFDSVEVVVTVSHHGGGGASSIAFLLILLAALAARRSSQSASLRKASPVSRLTTQPDNGSAPMRS